MVNVIHLLLNVVLGVSALTDIASPQAVDHVLVEPNVSLAQLAQEDSNVRIVDVFETVIFVNVHLE